MAEQVQPNAEVEAGDVAPPEVTEDAPETTEVDPALEGDAAPAAEGDAAAEKPADAPAKPEIPDDVLAAAAKKFANQTMAAARRAEARIEATKTENAQLKTQIQEHRDFFERFRAGDPAVFQMGGFGSVREFIDMVLHHGEPAAPSAEDRVTALERQLKERDDATKAAEQARAIEDSKAAVRAAVAKDTARYDLVNTDVGHDMLWDAIVAYHELHGNVPNEAIFTLADGVEKHLEEKFSKARKFSGQRPAETKKGTPAAAPAAPAARNGGKTLTNTATSSAPATREYSLDPDERRRQVTEDMRAAGEL